SVREPVQPLPARPPESRPAALVNAPESTSSSAEPLPDKPKAKFELPKILFEDDEPAAPPPTSGPGHKYAVGAAAAPPKQPERPQPLPQRLGSGNLTLTARDPHSLFA